MGTLGNPWISESVDNLVKMYVLQCIYGKVPQHAWPDFARGQSMDAKKVEVKMHISHFGSIVSLIISILFKCEL